MIRYMTAAVVLKAFSINGMTRSAYRAMGNVVGQKRRLNQNIDSYVDRGDLLVDLARPYGALEDGSRVVEIGTGWMHWFGLYLWLHGSVKVELFDVWDNRQLDALKDVFRSLRTRWANDPKVEDWQRERLEAIIDAKSFTDLYTLTGARYTIDDSGSLETYASDAYDAVVSFHVLEHVHRDIIERSIADMYRMLKPGGVCIHQIGINDHLSHYDSKESQKHYLRYSRTVRKLVFENVVQYHNALQGEDFLGYFSRAGFEMADVHRKVCDIVGLSVHPEWRRYSQTDLETTTLTVVCRKPAA